MNFFLWQIFWKNPNLISDEKANFYLHCDRTIYELSDILSSKNQKNNTKERLKKI
jgi:hypothetical protein